VSEPPLGDKLTTRRAGQGPAEQIVTNHDSFAKLTTLRLEGHMFF